MLTNLFSEKKFLVIAGPCVIESESLVLNVANKLAEISNKLNCNFVFKASFDKANRTALSSFRGLGLETGLKILQKVKSQTGLPVLTDVHDREHLDEIADVVDVLQTPAFLCRQTDFIQAVSKYQKPVNIKKGQFLAPQDMKYVVEKAKSTGNQNIFVCERGTCFGYHNLVVDMRSLEILKHATNCPVIFDATHSVQLPGGGEGKSSGQREFVPVLARAAVAVGISGVFLETHPNPDQALSDGPNSWPLDKLETLLRQLLDINDVIQSKTQSSDIETKKQTVEPVLAV